MINLKNKINNAIKTLIKERNIGVTYIIPLYKEYNKTWAVVLAWQDGYETTTDDEYHLGEYRICGKLAYNNSYMKEYDIDWIMPYDEQTGKVDDTECSIKASADIEPAINWWMGNWNRILNDVIYNEKAA